MKFDVRLDTAGAERMLARLSGEIRETAMARTLSRVADQGRTQMKREIAREFSITQSDTASKLYTRKPKRIGGTYVLQAELYSVGRGGRRSLNIIRFVTKTVTKQQVATRKRRARKWEAGIYAKVLRSSPQKVIAGAFVGNRGRTVFRRIGKERLPIEPVQVIDVPQMFNTKRVNERVRARMQAQLVVVAQQQLRYAITRVGA